MPNWEVYSRQGRNASSEPLVSIQRTGSLALNKAAYDAIGKPEAVQLLFDRQEQLIGLRPAARGDENAYVVRRQERSSTHLVAARTFTNYYDIDTSATRRYQTEMYDDVLGVHLQQERARGNSEKRGARAS